MVLAFNLMLSVQLSLYRMLKDAKKEKGQDDFLGYIVLKLKVFCITLINDCIIMIFNIFISDLYQDMSYLRHKRLFM